MYCIKLMRFCGAWLSIYIARRFFSDDYVDNTVFGQKPPLRLSNMIRMFAAIQLVFESIIATVLFLDGNASFGGGLIQLNSDNYFLPFH